MPVKWPGRNPPGWRLLAQFRLPHQAISEGSSSRSPKARGLPSSDLGWNQVRIGTLNQPHCNRVRSGCRNQSQTYQKLTQIATSEMQNTYVTTENPFPVHSAHLWAPRLPSPPFWSLLIQLPHLCISMSLHSFKFTFPLNVGRPWQPLNSPRPS